MHVIHDPNEINVFELEALIIQIKAIIYTRVSTQEQAIHGHSLESQIERCVQRGKEKFSYKDDEFLVLVEGGEMGDDPNRPMLNLMLNLTERGVGRKVIVLHPDRLARYLNLQNNITETILNAGVDLEFVEMSFDPNNPESVLQYHLQGSISQYNKAKILANSKRGRLQKIKKGQINGLRRLYGYSFDKENDTLVINEVEANVYRMVVDWILNGKDGEPMNISKCCEELSKRGIAAPLSNHWRQSTLSKILRNEVYKGYYFYGKTEIVQKHGTKTKVNKPKEEWIKIPIPALLDEETFEQLQLKLKSNARRQRGAKPKAFYLLKGLCRCGICGGALVSQSPARDDQGNAIRTYYGCRNKRPATYEVGTGRMVNKCKSRNYRSDVVDEYVWNEIVQVLRNPEKVVHEIVERQSNRNVILDLNKKKLLLRKQIQEINDKIDRATELYIENRITKQKLENYEKEYGLQLQKANEELQIVSESLNTLNADIDKLEKLEQYIQALNNNIELNNFTNEEKREFIQRIVKQVIIKEDLIEVYTHWDGQVPNDPESNQTTYNNSFHRESHGMNYKMEFHANIPRGYNSIRYPELYLEKSWRPRNNASEIGETVAFHFFKRAADSSILLGSLPSQRFQNSSQMLHIIYFISFCLF
jgi:site-specific DNA recombinase